MPGEGIAGPVDKPLRSNIQSQAATGAQAYLKELAIDCNRSLHERGIGSSKLVWLRSILVRSFWVLYSRKQVLAVGACLDDHFAVFEDVEIH